MAINPPSDIVLDVARAADPAARQAAVAKLAGAARPEDQGSQLFAGMMDQMQPSGAFSAIGSRTPQTANSKASEAYRSFEAFFIQNFLQSMLPKSSEANYGGGTAGEMWRSLSAEHMAKAIADAGGLGIAQRMMSQEAALHSCWKQDAKDPASAFSLGSISGAKPFQDWASYLPYMDPKYAGSMWNRPVSAAEMGSESLLADDV